MTKSNLNATAGGGWSISARVSGRKLRIPAPAPSLRLPATRENRTRLRELREAELKAWKNGSPNAALRAEVQNALAGRRSESWVFGGAAVIATVAVLFGAADSVDFVGNWNQFVSLIQSLLD